MQTIKQSTSVSMTIAGAMLIAASVLQRPPAPASTALGVPVSTPTPSTAVGPTRTAVPTPWRSPKPEASPATTRALVPEGLDLWAPPVEVPLRLRIPSIDVDADVLAVGLAAGRAMDAPFGAPNDPIWGKAFWYRGGAVPGASSTATIAGHYSGGRHPSVFRNLRDLAVGELILVDDRRTKETRTFVVTETNSYSTRVENDPRVLTRVYGAGPVAGEAPTPSADGLAHLTLITCAGDLIDGGYDRRLVVYAVGVDGPISP